MSQIVRDDDLNDVTCYLCGNSPKLVSTDGNTKDSIKGIVSPGAILTYMVKQGSRISVCVVKSLKKTDVSFNISFLFKILVIVVGKYMLFCPIHVTCPIHAGENGYSLEFGSLRPRFIFHNNI